MPRCRRSPRRYRADNTAVLVAPPGAGKTTRVPLVLAAQAWAKDGRIMVLEPRRLAARAAAERMARTLGERVGDTVGLRIRHDSKTSPRTRIEIVTEGVLPRHILADPMLAGIAAIVFDEFHERSLDADLGLALARDVQQGLREDLKILVMSATIDGARVATLLGGAPMIESEGRAFAVDTRYAGRDARPIEPQMADTIVRAMRADPGSLLAFLPGAAEIRRTRSALENRTDPATDVVALYGALSGRRAGSRHPARAARPPQNRAGYLDRRNLDHHRGRAHRGRLRTCPGAALRARRRHHAARNRARVARRRRSAPRPRRPDRTGYLLPAVGRGADRGARTLCAAGNPRRRSVRLRARARRLGLRARTNSPSSIRRRAPRWPKPPPCSRALGAIDGDGRITEAGKHLQRLPLPPRLARMVIDAAALGEAPMAATIAALLGERGLGGDDVDLRARLDGLRNDRSQRARDVRAMSQDWARRAQPLQQAAPEPDPQGRGNAGIGVLLALAFPERIAKNRGGASGAFLLANGRGANLDVASPLAREPFLAVAELTGSAAQGRIVSAAPITLAEIEARLGDRIEARDEVSFDAASASLRGRRSRRLGAVTLAEQPIPVVPDDGTAQKLADGIARIGIARLPWTKALTQWRDRVMFLRLSEGGEWPDLSDAALTQTASQWLAPALAAKTALAEMTPDELEQALHGLLPWPLPRRLDAEAPTHFVAPTGTAVAIDYQADGGPKISIRVQELFGLDRHPAIAGGKVPLVVELLSPAHRPVQMTRDLPGFWRGSYAAVRADMRGRYPKHPWPDDPIAAAPTRRAKPRTG